MSTSDSTVKGKYDEVAGKVKQGVGETFHDQSLANSGTAQQVKGHAEQAWGSVKEAAHDATSQQSSAAQNDAHSVRERVASTAQNAKEHIQAGVDSSKR